VIKAPKGGISWGNKFRKAIVPSLIGKPNAVSLALSKVAKFKLWG